MSNTPEYSEMLKALRKTRRALGKCTMCGTVDAYTMAGRARCAECAAKEAESKRKTRNRSSEAAKHYNAVHLQYTRKLRAEGKCPSCGVKLPGGDYQYKLCPKCRGKMRRSEARRRAEKGLRTLEEAMSGDTCFFCKSSDVVPGKHLCKDCLERCCGYLGLEKDKFGRWYRPKKVEVNNGTAE